MGQVLTRDPIGFEGGINLYEYVGNHPIGFVDPMGTLKSIGECINLLKDIEHTIRQIEDDLRHIENDPVTGNQHAKEIEGRLQHLYQLEETYANDCLGRRGPGGELLPEPDYPPWLCHAKDLPPRKRKEPPRLGDAVPERPPFVDPGVDWGKLVKGIGIGVGIVVVGVGIVVTGGELIPILIGGAGAVAAL